MATYRWHPNDLQDPKIVADLSMANHSLDHVILLNEQHLRRVLRSYIDYYHSCRTHQSLANDCPAPRAIEPPEMGKVIALPEVGGLHHRYCRRMAA